MTAVGTIVLLVGGGAFAVAVLVAMSQVRTPPTRPTPGRLGAAAALSLGSILLGSYQLVDAVTDPARSENRAWYAGSNVLTTLTLDRWSEVPLPGQLAVVGDFLTENGLDAKVEEMAGFLWGCISGAVSVVESGEDDASFGSTPVGEMGRNCITLGALVALSSLKSERPQDAAVGALGRTSATPWHREGTGAMVLDKPAAVMRVRITAQYDGWTQNFVVICGEAFTVLEFLGTDERSVHYEGTHRMDCSEVEISEATDVRWSFTEVP